MSNRQYFLLGSCLILIYCLRNLNKPTVSGLWWCSCHNGKDVEMCVTSVITLHNSVSCNLRTHDTNRLLLYWHMLMWMMMIKICCILLCLALKFVWKVCKLQFVSRSLFLLFPSRLVKNVFLLVRTPFLERGRKPPSNQPTKKQLSQKLANKAWLFGYKNLVLSTKLIMYIDHRTGILKADVSSVSPSSERIRSDEIFVYNSPTNAAPQFFRNYSLYSIMAFWSLLVACSLVN